MMQGSTGYCTAVRDPDGQIQIERLRLNRPPQKRRQKSPSSAAW